MASSTSPQRVPPPTWVPVNKASMASWRTATADPPAFGSGTADSKQREVCVVRAANCSLESVKAASAAYDSARVVQMSEPRAIAKGTTPGQGPAEAPPIEAMSPGLSPNPTTNDPPLPPPLEGGDGGGGAGGMPAMSLGPALEETIIAKSSLVCAVTSDRSQANDIAKKLRASGKDVVIDVVDRPQPQTCTVVLKGVPLSIKHDRLWQELGGLLSATPSYLRFHRNDRGLFKNVVYLKFRSPVDAELGRMELERFTVGGRPLKVEFKKPKAASVEETARAEAARREDLKVAMSVALETYVADLSKSSENEAFTLPKTQLTKDDQRFLRGVVQAHDDMSFDVGPVLVTVKKRMAKSPSPQAGPARTPPFHPATPSTHAADPAEVAGMQFRGIRHWREQRSTSASAGQRVLGLHRCVGPADGVKPFGPGRGRPQR